MQTRPTVRKPQTLKQAKAEFKKHGPRISSQEQRQLERGAELWRRAEKIKEAERRRKQTAEKRKIREEKVKEERKRLNIKAPEPWVSPRQTRVVNFFKCGKTGTPNDENKVNLHLRLKPEHVVSETGNNQSSDGSGLEQDTDPETDQDEPGAENQKGTTSHQVQLHRSFENFSFDEDTLAILDEKISQPIQTNAAVNRPIATDDDLTHAASVDIPSELFASSSQLQRDLSPSPRSPDRPDASTKCNQGSDFRGDWQRADTNFDLAMMLSTQDVNFSPEEFAEIGLRGPEGPLSSLPLATPMNSPCAHPKAPKYQKKPSLLPDAAVARSLQQSMPPPPMPTKVSPSNKSLDEAVVKWDPEDFVLSTQDCREILGLADGA